MRLTVFPLRIRGYVSRIGLLLVLLLAACGGGKTAQSPPPEVGVPPSLREDAGPPVQVVRLDERQAAELSVQTTRVRAALAPYTLSLPGEVLPAPDHYAVVSAPISGRVARIYAHEGEAVRPGQVLLELESLEFANLAADYLQARADAAYLEERVTRLRTLVEKQISPRSTLDKAEADLVRARAGVGAAFARLKALGLSDATIEGWSSTDRERPLLPVTAPIGGVIDRHLVDLGRSVTAYDEMLTLIDPARVLVRGFVPPEEAAFVQVGDTVEVGRQAASPHPLTGRIATINPALDPDNRAVVVNVLLTTEAGWPRPGQTVRLRIRTGTPRPVIAVPLEAVTYDGEQPVVFVRTAPDAFEKRPISIERVGPGEAVVTAGLRDGEEVAVSQVFSLKALSRFEQYAEE
ncbi:efflux RND transporter periplasmic adaptor subunit [Rhodocaloribacter litoris]|uniref:efflux RND transporter periplasmic adaptor subunit n=1 Tax=Rhodocaloribacter litoris TaxID=2558931 RepID=UPI00141F5FBA|nr:efflux RND transporter periplasmic adaptor subunit [Rhodocaloribacter litoris]QXD15858.1 efflux RND transporter periplasmic adaptor subunit [Rhodocaloribacter litoris]